MVEQGPQITDISPIMAKQEPPITDNPPLMAEQEPQITDNPPKKVEQGPQITDDPPKMFEQGPQITDNPPKMVEQGPQITDNRTLHIDKTPQLVPWISWREWCWVYDALFSSSTESVEMARRRIATWKGRGCVPVAVDITAAIKDIQQKDPFFVNTAENDTVSDEALRMAYGMAIIRFINGVIDQTRKSQSYSINDHAYNSGIPRLLVDIRHEASHHQLPSLPVLRVASKQALDWLKSHYWEPQKSSFEVAREIKVTFAMLARCIKEQMQIPNSADKKKLKRPKIKSSAKYSVERKRILFLYSTFPTDTVNILLECLLKGSCNFDETGIAVLSPKYISDVGDSSKMNKEIWSRVLETLCFGRRLAVPSLLRCIIERITSIESSGKGHSFKDAEVTSERHAVGDETKVIQELFYWLNWLLSYLENWKIVESCVNCSNSSTILKRTVPKECMDEIFVELLRSLAYTSSLAKPVLLLAKLLGKDSLLPKIERLVNLCNVDVDVSKETSQESFADHSVNQSIGQELIADPEQMHVSLEDAQKQFQDLKTLFAQMKPNAVGEGQIQEIEQHSKKRSWSIVEQWIPCPIGMLPSLTCPGGVLPDFARWDNQVKNHAVPTVDQQSEQQIQSLKETGLTNLEKDHKLMNSNKPYEDYGHVSKIARFSNYSEYGKQNGEKLPVDAITCPEQQRSMIESTEVQNNDKHEACENQSLKETGLTNLEKDHKLENSNKPYEDYGHVSKIARISNYSESGKQNGEKLPGDAITCPEHQRSMIESTEVQKNDKNEACDNSNLERSSSPLVTKGSLLSDGAMKPCNLDDIKTIQSSIRLFRF